MSRIPIWKDEDPTMPEGVREAIEYAKAGSGFALNIQREMANNPAVLKGFSDLAGAFYGPEGDTITPAERELAYTTATVVNNCHYWIPTHIMLGRSVGLTTEQLNHLGDDPLPEGVYTEAEAAIIRYAQKSTATILIDDDTYGDLAKHYNNEQMVEICILVGLSNTVNRFHATFLTDVDEATTEANAEADAQTQVCTLPRPRVATG